MPASIIPEDAPFNEEQRQWLNGFFAGWLATEQVEGTHAGKARFAADALIEATSGKSAEAAKAFGSSNGSGSATAVAEPPPAEQSEDESAEQTPADVTADVEATDEDAISYPWKDDSLSIAERMELADGKPKKQRLMAAMAQLDCGACGYLCNSYSAAIASGEESNLSLCSPGGKETLRMLKKVMKEPDDSSMGGASGAKAKPKAKQAEADITDPAAIGRGNPLRAKIKSIRNLNGEGSSKTTVHAELHMPAKDLTYRVGDSLGVFPTNCPELVDQIERRLRTHGTEHVVAPNGVEAQLQDALAIANLRDLQDETVQLVADSTLDAGEKKKVLELLEDDDKLDALDLLDLLEVATTATVDVKAFAKTLQPLQPRLYSIASSPRKHADEVHLTIARVGYYLHDDRERLGVASTMFCDRLEPGDAVQVYVHEAKGFTVPEDPSVPMIMVGPGTGIAPFRAFLEERIATDAPGKNWLFFGDQHEATDYLYGDEFIAMQEAGRLDKISTAFSRDQDEKIYVQNRMREEGAELYEWLEAGAYFYVCGDAKRMAGDVDTALHDIIAEHGNMSQTAAKAYVAELKAQERYVRDVY